MFHANKSHRAAPVLPSGPIQRRRESLESATAQIVAAVQALEGVRSALTDVSVSGEKFSRTLEGLATSVDGGLPEWRHVAEALPALATFESQLSEQLGSEALVGTIRAAEVEWLAQGEKNKNTVRSASEDFFEAHTSYKSVQDAFGEMKARAVAEEKSGKRGKSSSKHRDASGAAEMQGKKEELNQLHKNMEAAEEAALAAVTDAGFNSSHAILAHTLKHFEQLETALSNMGARLHIQILPGLRLAAESAQEEYLRHKRQEGTPAGKGIFGEHLEVICLREQHDSGVPAFVRTAITFLSHPEVIGMTGLFRLSPDHNEMKRMTRLLNHGEEFTVEGLDITDPHAVSSLLKAFLRELSEPLLTFKLYDYFCGISRNDDDEYLSKISAGIKQLPLANQMLLQHVMWILHESSSESNANSMTPPALATVFAPTILYSQEDKERELGNVGMEVQMPDIAKLKRGQVVVENMIDAYHDIFDYKRKHSTFKDLESFYATERAQHPYALAQRMTRPAVPATRVQAPNVMDSPSLSNETRAKLQAAARKERRLAGQSGGKRTRARSSTVGSADLLSASAPVDLGGFSSGEENAFPSSSGKQKSSRFNRKEIGKRFGSMRRGSKKSRRPLSGDGPADSGISGPTSAHIPPAVMSKMSDDRNDHTKPDQELLAAVAAATAAASEKNTEGGDARQSTKKNPDTAVPEKKTEERTVDGEDRDKLADTSKTQDFVNTRESLGVDAELGQGLIAPPTTPLVGRKEEEPPVGEKREGRSSSLSSSSSTSSSSLSSSDDAVMAVADLEIGPESPHNEVALAGLAGASSPPGEQAPPPPKEEKPLPPREKKPAPPRDLKPRPPPNSTAAAAPARARGKSDPETPEVKAAPPEFGTPLSESDESSDGSGDVEVAAPPPASEKPAPPPGLPPSKRRSSRGVVLEREDSFDARAAPRRNNPLPEPRARANGKTRGTPTLDRRKSMKATTDLLDSLADFGEL